MGAWGAGIFENDDAGDFVGELVESDNGWALVRRKLQAVADAGSDDYVESSQSSEALVAAECVATARGKASPQVDNEVLGWVQAHPLKDASKLVALAAKAVRRVATKSELQELWDEQDATPWKAAVGDLEQRLR